MMRYDKVIQGLKDKTEIAPEDNPAKELGKLLLKFAGYVVIIAGISTYLLLYMIFYVVGASWRGNRV
tara:strand:- start:389 stop:589 length:201 start_codon:yes stop_codon:yes gene_type:complete